MLPIYDNHIAHHPHWIVGDDMFAVRTHEIIPSDGAAIGPEGPGPAPGSAFMSASCEPFSRWRRMHVQSLHTGRTVLPLRRMLSFQRALPQSKPRLHALNGKLPWSVEDQ